MYWNSILIRYCSQISTILYRFVERRTLAGLIEAGEPLIQQAVDAMREYHQAQDSGAPLEEVERLRLLAESLFQVGSDFSFG
ncbi:hypothetical protein IEC33019_2081 [Pseudomonas putida]|uniref:Uncharacterized protein n=1 Tax=Pseudomonas putida TaxID=303 RepID=A0A1B2F616_PSEPU|nr:hypothetical protein IEC33019_2081 [Pseudomonas putida]